MAPDYLPPDVETTPLLFAASCSSGSSVKRSQPPYSPHRVRFKSESKSPPRTDGDESWETNSATSETRSTPSDTVDSSSSPDNCLSHDSNNDTATFYNSLRNLQENCISMTLKNQGSVARDHLALERTFLAYVRTSLALASAGVALVQLLTVAEENGHIQPIHPLQFFIRPLGAATIAMGLLVLIVGVNRYFSVQLALTQGNFPISRLTIGSITFVLGIIIIVTFAVQLVDT